MKNITFSIDGRLVTASDGQKVPWAAQDNGIYVPNLCAVRGSDESSACRLCFIEVVGKEQPVTACTEPVSEGLIVKTRGEKALKLARSAFELIMASHPEECAKCPKNGECELQKIARHLDVGLKTRRLREILRNVAADESHPAIGRDSANCVLCGRCIRACAEGPAILGFAHRGSKRAVETFSGRLGDETRCLACARCVSVCPTGALFSKA